MNRPALAVLVLAACRGAPPALPPVVPSAAPPVAVEAGPHARVVEAAGALYVLGARDATIVRGGAVTARITAPAAWMSAATIAAPDGGTRWVVAADARGALWRLFESGEREAVADRFGLGAAQVRAVGGAGATTAFDLGGAIAYTTDGIHLARVPAAPGAHLAVARGELARTVGDHVERWDLVHATQVTYPIAATALAFVDADSDHPRLVAAAGPRVWIEAAGELREVRAPAAIQALAARGDRLWLATADQLLELVGDRLAPAQLADHRIELIGASPAGDAWLATERGLVRYSLAAPGADPAWTADVAPVFQRVCARCHLPGGDADFDLSTAASWQADRAELVRRVLVDRTMPPAGTVLSDGDRAELAAWLQQGH